MTSSRLTPVILVLLSVSFPVCAQIGAPVANWAVPPDTRRTDSSGLAPLADVTQPGVFIAVAPCRVVDTRGPAGPYGGPPLAANVVRSFNIESGPCAGIAPLPGAFSLNFGAILPPADGFLTAWPVGTSQPTVSQLNLLGGEVVANAAIVPGSPSGSINVLVNVGPTNIYIDINGYFISEGNLNPNESLNLYGNTVNCLVCIHNFNANALRAIDVSMVSGQNAGAVIWARNDANTGSHYGVAGIVDTAADNSAAIFGLEGTSFVVGTHVTAGVRGESAIGGTGVLGLVSDPAGEGTTGFMVNGSNGLILSGGHLGYSSTVGVYFDNGLAGSGTKSFVEPHPTDASKAIKFISLEGNEPGTYFRGRGRFQNGIAVITVPEEFRMVTDPEDLSIQVTPIREMATVAVQSIDLDRIVVKGSRNVEFFYLVHGVRRAYKGAPIVVDNEKFFVPESAESTIPQYLSPDEKQRLIANGTYRPDGTVNMETAERLGWRRRWEAKRLAPPRPAPDSP